MKVVPGGEWSVGLTSVSNEGLSGAKLLASPSPGRKSYMERPIPCRSTSCGLSRRGRSESA
jgi:hypothetical protein